MVDFLTTGGIATRLNVDRDQVSYALRKLQVKPLGVAAGANVYAEDCIEAVRTFLINKRKRVSV